MNIKDKGPNDLEKNVFNYDERKKFMLKCNYCNEKGEVEITEEVIKKLEEGKGVN